MTEREKRIAIVAVVIVIIILLLLFLNGKRRGQVVPYYDDANLTVGDLAPLGAMPSLGDLTINLGDLLIPDLTIFRGVSKCGCGPKIEQDAPRPPVPYTAPAPTIQRANYQTAPRPAQPKWGWAQTAPLPPKNYAHNSSFWGGGFGS